DYYCAIGHSSGVFF
nr:immunoglobulin light chain junction region [Macaca mulatta]MOX77803.1 immunoglobulin light chain junction region [Macaca mulatta]MOX78501.1 immunoglobulin light chain junction region [Macaca mulatta]MOX79415.1 immunoglobulin light chain junction region [Macaca mulatta]MOX80437.1 immunoglobulin light chain junction region [Macaca mulatta]